MDGIEVVNDTTADFLYALLLVGFDALQQGCDIVDFLCKLLLKGGSLLCAEVNELV